jgi:hypothetical protein
VLDCKNQKPLLALDSEALIITPFPQTFAAHDFTVDNHNRIRVPPTFQGGHGRISEHWVRSVK